MSRADELEPTTPPAMPYDLLAELISVDGAADLHDAAQRIERACHRGAINPLDEDEQKWLRALADHKTIDDIAAEADISRSTLYRRLERLCTRIGADNHQQATLIALQRGWI